MFQTARFAAGRISEVVPLKWENVCNDFFVMPKCISKKVRPREIPRRPTFKEELTMWRHLWADKCKREPGPGDFLFPAPTSADLSKHAMRRYVERLLRAACEKLGHNGVSTHSFRRPALTTASEAGIPVRHIMELSGHSSMAVLQSYLQCSEQQKRAVAMAFG